MDSTRFKISGNIVDVEHSNIYGGEVEVEGSKIISVRSKDKVDNVFILPGLIDAHVHIESSMLVPAEFAKAASRHGTVACVSDPHEIANVVGKEGVKFMIENGNNSEMKFYFGAPSCVPATNFETSGAVINAEDIRELLLMENIVYLSEMMNYPGVIFNDPEVHKKLDFAKNLNKRIDGHAPGLRGEDLKKYINSGISTDHECTNLTEAEEKIHLGMSILIREGSSAKNFDALYKLIDLYPDNVMLCSDDLHPNDLIKGHINLLIKRGLSKNLKLFNLLKAATINPIKHYGLKIGLLNEADPADFIVVNSLNDFEIIKTFVNGNLIFGGIRRDDFRLKSEVINKFDTRSITLDKLKVRGENKKIKVIKVIDKELITKSEYFEAKIHNGSYENDLNNDVLKIVVYNRYQENLPSVAFISGFGLTRGAIASSIAHDSHNIVSVGTNDTDIMNAINKVIEDRGAIVCACGDDIFDLPLEIAGLMSLGNANDVAKKYEALDRIAKDYGSKLTAPFMTLSFMALLVIPELKLSDKGLFDGIKFNFTTLNA